MHQPLDRAFGVVADRVVDFGRIAKKLAPLGHELARDRVGRVAFRDEAGERRGQADRVALRDRLEFGEPRRIGEAGLDQCIGRGQAARCGARSLLVHWRAVITGAIQEG